MLINSILSSLGNDDIVIKEELLDRIIINKQNGEEVSFGCCEFRHNKAFWIYKVGEDYN